MCGMFRALDDWRYSTSLCFNGLVLQDSADRLGLDLGLNWLAPDSTQVYIIRFR